MKHGKKYTDGAKLIDRSNLYDSKEALDLTVKTATAKFDETVEVHIRLGVDSLTLISRFVALLFFLTVQVRTLRLLFSLRATLLRLLQKQVLTLLAMLTLFKRFRAAGWISTLLSHHLI